MSGIDTIPDEIDRFRGEWIAVVSGGEQVSDQGRGIESVGAAKPEVIIGGVFYLFGSGVEGGRIAAFPWVEANGVEALFGIDGLEDEVISGFGAAGFEPFPELRGAGCHPGSVAVMLEWQRCAGSVRQNGIDGAPVAEFSLAGEKARPE